MRGTLAIPGIYMIAMNCDIKLSEAYFIVSWLIGVCDSLCICHVLCLCAFLSHLCECVGICGYALACVDTPMIFHMCEYTRSPGVNRCKGE